MLEKLQTDFMSKKFFVLFVRWFSLERSYNYCCKSPVWQLCLRFSIAWNHKGYHLVYRWASKDVEDKVYLAGIEE